MPESPHRKDPAPAIAWPAPADRLETQLARREGTEAAVVLGSGMGATACALLALLRPGDHLLASAWLDHRTRQFLDMELPMLGIDVTHVDPDTSRAWRRLARPNTRAVYLASPVGPGTRVIDVRPISAFTRDLGFALLVDASWASPATWRPHDHGADVVVHDASALLADDPGVSAGVVAGAAAFIEEVWRKAERWGQVPDPYTRWMLARGLGTLDVRVQRQQATAMRLATWLAAHPAVRSVRYPGLPTHPDHAVAQQLLDGFGAVIGVSLVGGGAAAARVLDACRSVRRVTAFGGLASQLLDPHHRDASTAGGEPGAAASVREGDLTLRVGLEAADDLVADLARALE
jgi:cystathionine beta-lyase/cystathionine gamma-synthase